MTDRTFEINPGGSNAPYGLPNDQFYDQALDAIDLASDQDQRTAITDQGKVIAWIVTAEDGELLGRLDPGRRRPPGYPAGVISHPVPDADGNIPVDEPPGWRPPDPDSEQYEQARRSESEPDPEEDAVNMFAPDTLREAREPE